jgi:hypothetical protein
MSNACGAGGSSGAGKGKWRVAVVKKPVAAQTESASMPMPTDDYNRQLAEVLRTRDVFRFRHLLASSGRALPDEMMLDVLKLATMMHQMIVALPELADMHDFSRQWLDDNTLLTSNNRSLNEAAQRKPGEAPEGLPAPKPGRRTITLRTVPPVDPRVN